MARTVVTVITVLGNDDSLEKLVCIHIMDAYEFVAMLIMKTKNDLDIDLNLTDEAMKAISNVTFHMNAYWNLDPQDNHKVCWIDNYNVLSIIAMVEVVEIYIILEHLWLPVGCSILKSSDICMPNICASRDDMIHKKDIINLMKDEPSAVMIEFHSEKVKKRYLSDILGYYCGNTGQEEMMITILNKMYNLE